MSPALSPLFGDLSGLPPTSVFHGTADMLISEARRLKADVLNAGGQLNLYEYSGAFHVFMAIQFLPESQRSKPDRTLYQVH
jgi:monoterpene epsilon-lactone hydrolase